MNGTIEIHDPEIHDPETRDPEIHEPEIQKPELKQQKPEVRKEAKPAGRAAVLPRAEIRPQIELPELFSDCLLDFEAQRKRRAFATTMSFLLNCLAIGGLLLLPLYFTQELPQAQLLTFLVAPPPPPPPPPPAGPAQAMARVVRRIQTDMLSTGELRTPARIPQRVQMIKEDEAPPPLSAGGGVIGGVPGGVPGGQLGGVIGGIISATSSLAAVPKMAPVKPVIPQRLRISQGVTRGMLVHRVEPEYPMIAKRARVQGQVVLSAIIDTNGEIKNLELVSGHPLLVPAALAAVKQWRYRPFLLNGQPIEVETVVTVSFELTTG